jgi:hypothetical protein
MQFVTETGSFKISFDQLTIAGWTGRDATAVRHHIDELAALGVTPPSRVPLFYRAAASLLTFEPAIEVLGDATSGEAEPMLIQHDGKVWLGLASDHTDRALEATSVAASKQICQKPCAPEIWDLDSVAGHLDRITIRSWIWESDSWHPYQDGSIGQILPLRDLLSNAGMTRRSALLCGTFPALGGVRTSSRFRASMHDPLRDAGIHLEYETLTLPIVS